jgi:hypothetical protein
VQLLAIDLVIKGMPSTGTANIVAAGPGPGPNNITITLPDGGIFFTSYSGSPGKPPEMRVTLNDVEQATGTQTGSSSLYCIHGFVTADVPKLSPGVPTVIHLDAGF